MVTPSHSDKDARAPAPGLQGRAPWVRLGEGWRPEDGTRRMRRRSFIRRAGAALAGALLPGAAAGACRVFPADGEVEFTALRHGEVVGWHRIRFLREPGRLRVRTDVEIEFAPRGVSVFRFVHHAEEIWVAGWLQALVADTDDDGRRYRLRAERRQGIFQGTINGSAFTVSGYIVPSSLWHRDTPASEALFDTVDGRVKIVRARLLGREAVAVRGRPVQAKRYALRGELQRDLWYDSACTLVRAAWLARDGSRIVLEPR